MPEGATATDLVLTITEMLRQHKVVGKFVEFYGPGVSAVPLANRATIGNMSPEYGSTIAVFPIDSKTTDYLRLTGRRRAPDRARRGLRARSRASGTTTTASRSYSEYLELDLGTVVPSIAGPKRPQDRVILAHAKQGFREALAAYVDDDQVPPVGHGRPPTAELDDAPDAQRLRRVGRRELPGLRRPEPLAASESSDPHEFGEGVAADIGRPSRSRPWSRCDGQDVRDRPRRRHHRRRSPPAPTPPTRA